MEFLKSVRFLILLFLIVTLALGCAAMIYTARLDSRWRKLEEYSLLTDSVAEVFETDSESSQEVWIMKACDEKIGIYKLNGELECVLDVYLITLPNTDRELLENGIYVSGRERLTALVEDYTG